MSDTTPKRRTITLTDRPPVTILETAWPVLASASDKDYTGEDESQAYETSKWWVTVRQHQDGRTIVYGGYSYARNGRERRAVSVRGGELLPSPSSMPAIVEAIGDVTDGLAAQEHSRDDAARWVSLRRTCIADLPAEVL